MTKKPPQATLPQLLRSPTMLLAFGFGAGLAPRAPGTFGTLMAIPFWWLLQTQSPPVYLAIVVLAAVLGCYLCGAAAKKMGVHDHGGIVWDEMVGYWLTMFLAPSGWGWALYGFILFRIFDIAKPPPIGWVDRKLRGGTGIMLDDILAAGYAAAVLQLSAHFMH